MVGADSLALVELVHGAADLLRADRIVDRGGAFRIARPIPLVLGFQRVVEEVEPPHPVHSSRSGPARAQLGWGSALPLARSCGISDATSGIAASTGTAQTGHSIS